jgi:iron complex transport system substrate-binding protein
VRIISLLPSATEILFAIGAGDDVVGVTSDCDYPPAARTRAVVSAAVLEEGLTPAAIDATVRQRLADGEDLYRLDTALVGALEPDLVVTQDLCAVCAVDVTTVDHAVASLSCPARVLTIDPASLNDVLASITALGEATGRTEAARAFVTVLADRLGAVATAVRGRPRPPTLVLEWTEPPFSAGHWVPDMVDAAGAIPLLCEHGGRSVPLSLDDVRDAAPGLIVVAPCGFHLEPAVQLAQTLLASSVLPFGAEVWAVDADAAFVRPGPRLVDGIEALAAVAHPGALPPRPELARYVGTTSAKTKPSRSITSPTSTAISRVNPGA